MLFILLLKSAFFEFLTFMKGENKNRDAISVASLLVYVWCITRMFISYFIWPAPLMLH